MGYPLKALIVIHTPKSTSFRHGLPESRLHGCIQIAIHGAGYRLPSRYDDLLVPVGAFSLDRNVWMLDNFQT